MQSSGNNNERRWLTEDFTEKFRKAFGREMTAEERQYFGLENGAVKGEERPPDEG
jgi:hypothetical protein